MVGDVQNMNARDQVLASAFRAIRDGDSALDASPAVEQRLKNEVRSLGRARRRRGQVTLAGIAAAVIVAVAVPDWRTVRRVTSGETAFRTDARGPDASADEAAFFPLPYIGVPMSNGQIVRLEVPQATLDPFGVALADVMGGARPGMVLADVIVGEDGLARAVRFVTR